MGDASGGLPARAAGCRAELYAQGVDNFGHFLTRFPRALKIPVISWESMVENVENRRGKVDILLSVRRGVSGGFRKVFTRRFPRFFGSYLHVFHSLLPALSDDVQGLFFGAVSGSETVRAEGDGRSRLWRKKGGMKNFFSGTLFFPGRLLLAGDMMRKRESRGGGGGIGFRRLGVGTKNRLPATVVIREPVGSDISFGGRYPRLSRRIRSSSLSTASASGMFFSMHSLPR